MQKMYICSLITRNPHICNHIADIGAWIAENHDPPVGENVLEPDPAAAAAYDAAFALYRRRGESLFGGGER